MKVSKKNLLICALSAFLVIFIILFAVIISAKNKKSSSINIAFYEISENLQNQFKEELEKNLSSVSFNFKTLDGKKNILEQIDKKTDLVILPEGKSASNLISTVDKKKKSKFVLDSSVLSGTTISVLQKAVVNEDLTVSLLPLLIDGEMIFVNSKNVAKEKITNFESIVQIANFAERKKSSESFPITFSAADSVQFLNLISSLTECLENKEAVLKASKMIVESNGNYDFNSLCSKDDAPLYEASHTISNWYKRGLITSETFKMQKNAVHNLMEMKETSVVFESLSDYRTLPYQTAKNFETIPEFTKQREIYFPTRKEVSQRSVVCNLVSLVPLSGKEESILVAKELVSTRAQEFLARASGLAPVLAQCKTPDVQSGDLRFWVASSSAPLTSLAYSAFETSVERENFSSQLIEYIKNNF